MAQKRYFGFSQNVFVLSIISFLNDLGGETIKRMIPLFLTNVLGVGTSIVGIVEGVASSTPHLLEPIAGWLSDRQIRRKPYVILGQLLRSLMVLLAAVTTWWQVLLLRFVDRSGKGIQDAPRDALLSLSAKPREQGGAFGLNRAFDYGGSVLGLLGAGFLIWAYQREPHILTRAVFVKIVLLAAIPLFTALILTVVAVREESNTRRKATSSEVDSGGFAFLPAKYWLFLGASFLFSMGNSSDGFVLLRGQNIGLSLHRIFFLFAGFSLVTALISYPLGRLSDTHSRKKMLATGWFLYALVYLGLTQVTNFAGYAGLLGVYGIYYGFTEGVGKALMSDLLDRRHKGVGFGLYNLVVGGTLLPASILAGFLWEAISPAAPFYLGAMTATLASISLIWLL